MKKSILIAQIILLILSVLAFFLISENQKLNEVIEKQNTFIKDIIKNDSTFNVAQKKLKDSLDDYTHKLRVVLKDENVNPNTFIDAFRKVESQRDSLKLIYDLAQEYYGFKIKFNKKTKDNTTTSTATIIKNSRADSAETTYYFFKNRIFKKGDSWYADGTSKKDLEELEKKLNERKTEPKIQNR